MYADVVVISNTCAVTEDLTYNAEAVAALMLHHQIHSRSALAKVLGIPRSSVTREFAEDWSGHASSRMIAALCAAFRVPIARIVTEPAVAIRRVNNKRIDRIPDRLTQ